MVISSLHTKNTLEERIEPRLNDEIAESVKATMKALEDLFGARASPKQAALRTIGSEYGHIVARNISHSSDPDIVLKEIAAFWNNYALGDMSIEKGDPSSFTLKNCFDCKGEESADLICG